MLFPTLHFAQDRSALISLQKTSEESLINYEYKDAIEAAMQLLDEAKKFDDNYFHYHAHKVLGSSYNDLNDTLRAKRHYEQALEYAQKSGNDTLILGAYNNLGNIYSEDKKTTQKGIDYYNLVINLATRMDNKENIFTPTVNIAWTYIDNKQYAKAWPYLKRSWEMYEGRNDFYIESQLNNLTKQILSWN
ncbi:tetratricopeptide repeat protein [Antarcticibacterium sp. 1MA-6-2]|uniref:tetratricopeptide repeat protein n=1 Tax=Antarcticibacterium sp. 1MA-6-2 TaxID=2908210 RepID=UPI001F2F3B9F|nr:tetratricopeptide repeat protein [Antarcticibacterium sp. 1MA-6-2]UJH92403.1 tetratricopeptide repeat protein [Antarcticibacterium sp. 1MA-6-2]